MRFHYGAVPENEAFHPEAEGWRSVREPNPLVMQLFALPLMFLLMAGWGLSVLLFMGPEIFFPKISGMAGIAANCLLGSGLFFLMIPLHELIHALFHPGWGFSTRTVIGLWLSKALFYAHYEGIMSRNRFLMVFLAPYPVLGVLPTIAAIAFPEWRPVLLPFSFWGSIMPCGDFVGLMVVLFQIPASAIVQNKGWKTYWKPSS
jgi:hypothetical protein